MSTPPPARPNVPQGTRQLLDELDALMQRMLAVPVNELGDAPDAKEITAQATETIAGSQLAAPLPAAAPKEGEPANKSPDNMFVATHQAAPALPAPHRKPQPDRPAVHVPQTPAQPAPGEVPLGGFWPHPALQSPHLRETTGQPPSAPPHWSPPPGQRSSPSFARPTSTTHRPTANWWLQSLLWSNRTFDRCTASLGRPGRWLQGRGGRMLLGWLGIALLIGSLAWGLSNWFDWTW